MLGIDQAQRYKDCPNCLNPARIMVGGKETLWFLDALKRSISELILPEKTLKEKKCFSLKAKLLHVHVFQNFWTFSMTKNSAFHYESLPLVLYIHRVWGAGKHIQGTTYPWWQHLCINSKFFFLSWPSFKRVKNFSSKIYSVCILPPPKTWGTFF